MSNLPPDLNYAKVLSSNEQPVGLDSADHEQPEELEGIEEPVAFNEVGSASILGHRPWWKQISEFLIENIESSVHGFRLIRGTVAPTDPNRFDRFPITVEAQVRPLEASAMGLRQSPSH